MLVFVLQQSWKRIFSLYKIKSQHSASVRPRNISDVITLLVIRCHVTVVSLLQESKIKIMEMKYIYEKKDERKWEQKRKKTTTTKKTQKLLSEREKKLIYLFFGGSHFVWIISTNVAWFTVYAIHRKALLQHF